MSNSDRASSNESARKEILAAVARHQPQPTELPSPEQNWITYPDRIAKFADVLLSIGGQFFRVSGPAEAEARLKQIPAYRTAKQTISLVPGIGQSNFNWSNVNDPHALEPVDFAVMAGEFAVAENAGIWVTDRHVKWRALYFIAQHLALVISANQIVDNMHQAYDRLQFHAAEFGTFIAGPSKTADIEQSLVIGAHGPRSLTVFCVG
ncbi:MAG TPA: LUD domain-containing protein [Pirellulales bacterium]